MKSSSPNKPQILVLVSRFPYPLEKGDKLRAFHQLIQLSREFDITLVSICDKAPNQVALAEVSKYCNRVEFIVQTHWSKMLNMAVSFFNGSPLQVGYFKNRKASNLIKQLIEYNPPKHIYCQLIRMSNYVKDIHHIPKTLDYMDALSMGINRRIEKANLFTRWIFKLEAKRLKIYERKMFDYFDTKSMISDQDIQLIAHPENRQILKVTNGIDPSFLETPQIEKTHDFVFVGNMSYPPNVDAVEYVAKNILSELVDKTFLISGSSPSSSVKQLASSNAAIDITGWVDDIRESYARGKIFLAPMMIGTGMQNKLLEAMALGVPCITTPLSSKPIGCENELNILVAETPEEFIECINRLMTNEELYNQIAQNARKFVQERYSWEIATEPLIHAIKDSIISQ